MPNISIGLTDKQYAFLLTKKKVEQSVQDIVRQIIDSEMEKEDEKT